MKITQKHRSWKASFEFGPDQLEYSFSTKHNAQGGTAPYHSIPLLWRTHLKKVWAEKYVALGVAFLGIATINNMIANTPSNTSNYALHNYVTGINFAAFGFIFVSALIFILQMIGRPPTLTIIKGQPNICIIQDEQHDVIAAGIRKRRMDALRRKFAFNDPLGTPASEAKKFRWLLENDAITEKEFSDFMAQLAPHESSASPVTEEKKTLH